MEYIFNYSKLRGRIVEKFGTLKAFFEKLPITEVMASKKINGKAGFSQKDIIEWCKLLDIDFIEIPMYFFCLKDLTS